MALAALLGALAVSSVAGILLVNWLMRREAARGEGSASAA
jgi:hypothetical protein